MPKQGFLAAGEGMPSFSRRSFIRGMGAATALAGVMDMPAIAGGADISAGGLSNEQQIEACIAQLKVILWRLHPVVTKISHGYHPKEDGTFHLWMHCERAFLEWSGPGLYRVSEQGSIMTLWLEKVEERTVSGRVYGHVFLADMYCEDKGRFVGVRRHMHEPKIVEKLEGLEA